MGIFGGGYGFCCCWEGTRLPLRCRSTNAGLGDWYKLLDLDNFGETCAVVMEGSGNVVVDDLEVVNFRTAEEGMSSSYEGLGEWFVVVVVE